jgi:glutathione S-transferase
MIKLYYTPKTRAGRVRWMLEELNLKYELIQIDLRKGEQKTPEYLKIHPQGAVPALSDGDQTLIESAAIVAYLADHYGEGKFSPPLNSIQRGPFYQWLFYGMNTIEPPVGDYFRNTILLPEPNRDSKLAEKSKTLYQKTAAVCDRQLSKNKFIIGDEFSACDVVIASILDWATAMKITPQEYSNCFRYLELIKARPAFQKSRHD